MYSITKLKNQKLELSAASRYWYYNKWLIVVIYYCGFLKIKNIQIQI